jgi:HAD superfamily hydrolase (TIGR01509 family)
MNNSKLNVKGIMFDLDGTVLDTKPAYLEAAKIAFKIIGQTAPTDVVSLEIPKRMEQKLPLTGIVDGNRKAFVDVYLKTFYKISASKTKPMPKVADALKVLSKKAKLAVITMRFAPGHTILSELRQFKLEHYFDHVVTGLDTVNPKPSPEALQKTVAAFGVHMSECVIVGDSVVDIAAGKAAGAKTVAVLTGLYSQVELAAAKPDFIISDVTELPTLIS